MGTRYKGSASGDRLSQTTVYNEDMIQTRHGWSDATEDSDKGLPLSVIQSTPVAVCSTSATEQKKSATVQNFPDFTLLNGREVIVYMANGNSASEPSLSINGSDYFLMESAYWNAGTFLKLRYVSVTINGTTIQKWLVEQGATNTAAQLNGALTNISPYSKKAYSTDIGQSYAKFRPANFGLSSFGSGIGKLVIGNNLSITTVIDFTFSESQGIVGMTKRGSVATFDISYTTSGDINFKVIVSGTDAVGATENIWSATLYIS